jgi:hypothetical protein
MNPSRRTPNRSDEEKQFVSKAGWYSLLYPSHWVVQEEEDCDTFSDPENGVGALQVSAYQTPGSQNSLAVLREYLSDSNARHDENKLVSYEKAGTSIASCDYMQGRWAKRVWFLSCGNYLLMVTYNCKVEDQEVEAREVERVLESITLYCEKRPRTDH